MAGKRNAAKAVVKRRGDGPQIVYDYLRGEIVALRLAPGSRIEEKLIVEHLGISRTPVRQALMRMASEGLVELLQNRGARVTPLDLEEVRAFFEAFEIMLKTTIHLAAKRRSADDLAEIVLSRDEYEAAVEAQDIRRIVEANEKFHLTIARAGRNSHLVRLVGDLLTKAVRLDGIWYSGVRAGAFADDLRRSVEEHESLVRAILEQDAAEAERLTLAHTRSFREPFLRFLSESEAAHIRVGD